MAELVITCISDDEGFPTRVYEHLISVLEKQRDFAEGRDVLVDRHLVRLTGNEILVDSSTKVPKEMAKWALESFLKQNGKELKDYQVIEFGDALTIARVLHPSKMDMFTCEICGFFTPHEGEVETHRMTHFAP